MTLQEYVDSIKDKKITVIGIGVSNRPLMELLLENGCDVTACDKSSAEQLGEAGEKLASLGAKLKLGEDYLEDLEGDIIFRTPGLMPFDSHLEAAKAKGSIITSEMEVFFSLCPCRIIAITGSDGKTTTSTIISELLKAQGYTAHLGGNIGTPLLCTVDSIKPDDFAVLELSSFQLHSMSCHPDVAVITNISPNHLDKHKDFQDYVDAKMSIFTQQTEADKLILCADDGHSEYYANAARSQLSFFSDRSSVTEGCMLHDGKILRVHNGEKKVILDVSDILLPGEHNVLNYMTAFCATDGIVSDDVCRSVAGTFAGVEHRLEHFRVFNGVTYINDSIGSSPSRTVAGLRAMKKPPIVIAGGYDKKVPFDTLGDELCLRAKSVFLTGDTANKIRDAIFNSENYKAHPIDVSIHEDFTENVYAAVSAASEGDVVLFSPACASFDHFRNFAERGKFFKKIIMELK